MNRQVYKWDRVVVALLFMLVTQSLAAQMTKEVTAIVDNRQRFERQDEPVVIRMQKVNRQKFVARSAVVKFGNEEIPCQMDDLDGDGVYDELAFVANFAANETKEFTIVFSDSEPQRQYRPRVYADMILEDRRGLRPFITSIEAPKGTDLFSDLYHHGVAFESEVTAYRVYFDKRQNVDIYGKRIRRLELPDTHFYTTAEQLEQGYGNDVLWAGSTVGCGTLKLWDGTRMINWENISSRGQRLLASGPVRTVVEVVDRGVEGMTVTTRYTLYAGHREVLVETNVSQPIPRPMFCTGVQKVGRNPSSLLNPREAFCVSWGTDYPEQSNDQMMQLFPPEAVGMAVFVPREHVVSFREDDQNCLLVIGKPGTTSFHYYLSFCADKEVNGFHDKNDWFACMKDWKKALTHPLRVRLSKQKQ